MKIRKMLTVVEEIYEDGGKKAARPIKKVAAVAVIENPFAGRYVEDLEELVKTGEELGDLLGRRATAALGAPVHSYGKAAKKLGGPGATIDVPLHYKDAAFVRTHFDAMEVRLGDAPRGDEILVALVVTDGGRPHARVGGLTVDEAKKEDGLR